MVLTHTNDTPYYVYLWSVDTTGKYIYGGIFVVLTNETTHYIIMVEMVSS